MTLTARKLFGSLGAPAQAAAAAPAAETASPEYGAWYAQKMASAYAASRGDRTVVQLVRQTLGGELPLAA
ncbi:hypothetical protein [Novosphingobium sp. JCM 18896]|uniref:hypothetical protein n=1 Tax=Novosphingobium sp. JCM 18896 TaxID=2989731 RepID=UPI002223D184|nr:hypothetical protein [Novosphingobium sp. JCM 18896]MCW1428560.1 hypothetical protein [Novosphingobium sp. JCM 18896]